MKIVKKEVTTEVVDYVESNDGKYVRKIGELCTLEQAEKFIGEYEKQLSTVIWERMIDRGLLHEINGHGDIPYVDMTPEQKHDRLLYNILDMITDAGCGNYSYYVFKPETEQDIIDLLTYAKSSDDTEDIWFPTEEYKDESLCCTRSNLIPGYKYLYCEHCDGYAHLYRLDDYRAKLNKVIDSLEEF